MASIGDSRYAPPSASVADVAPTPGKTLLASRWRRLGASIIDSFLVFVVALVFGLLTHWNLFEAGARSKAGYVYINMLLAVCAFLVLNGYLLVTRGQTIAKAALGIRIVRPDGGKVSAARIIGLRYLPGVVANLIPALGGLFALIDCLLIFRESRRCLHDDIADTIVIRI